MIGEGFNYGEAIREIKGLEMIGQLVGSQFLELGGSRADHNRNLCTVSFLSSQSRNGQEC